MGKVTATPTSWSVYNEFDKQGLLLGLPRLSEERNPEYKQRLMDVFVHRASSVYKGLINGITRELGLSIIPCMSIVPVKDSDGDSLLTNPGVEFLDTQCILYEDIMTEAVLQTIDRFDSSDNAYTLGDLASKINATGYFTAILQSQANSSHRSMTIFNQSSFVTVTNEELSGSGSRIVLENNNLVEGSVTIESPNLTRRVYSESNVNTNGAYYIKLKQGVILSQAAPAPGSIIRYIYRDDEFIAESSPIIIHSLQSDDFKRYMFENAGDAEGVGLPTPLGASIINELMSVFNAGFGE